MVAPCEKIEVTTMAVTLDKVFMLAPCEMMEITTLTVTLNKVFIREDDSSSL